MLRLKIESIRQETPDAATYFLSEADGKAIKYQAGQFITLIFNHRHEEIRRSYSISSSPDEPLLSVTVKRIPNGEISRFILRYAKTGEIWTALEPAGRFVLNNFAAAKDVFFFAAGSGIAPILSQLKYLLNREGKSMVTLIYSNQDEDNILFKNQLTEVQAKHADRFTIIHLLSSDANRLNNIMLEKLVNQHAKFLVGQADFYLCGPFSYMRMIRLTLLYMGIEPQMIHKENFVLPTVSVSDPKTIFPPRKLQLNFRGATYHITAGENQSILQAALQNRIPIPFSCLSGICSTCSAKCSPGQVSITQNEVLTDAEIANGWILTCTGYAVSDDVVISFE